MIKIKNLYKSFGTKKVLEDISFDVHDGEILVIIGSSGTGKSILLKNIVGLIHPDSGSVFIDDIDITKCPSEKLHQAQKKMGYVFQESALFDSLTIEENVAFGLHNLTNLSQSEIKERVKNCLSMVGLKDIEQLKPSSISGGMKKRVAIARAISYQPRYLFYDEPTTGLDPIMTDVISDLIVGFKQKVNVTSIVVTHDMKSAYKIADRIMMLHQCKIVFSASSQETKDSDNPLVRQFIEGTSTGPIEIERTFKKI
jgi:phospholipid/cholesterol/gamma-HCH transport system ATP-binding protein